MRTVSPGDTPSWAAGLLWRLSCPFPLLLNERVLGRLGGFRVF